MCTDVDGDNLTYGFLTELPADGSQGTISIDTNNGGFVNGPHYIYTPAPDFSTNGITIRYNCNDGNLTSNQESPFGDLTFIVTAVDDAPILANIGDKSTNEDTPLTFTVTATDVDSDILSFTCDDTAATHLTCEISNVQNKQIDITIIPYADWFGTEPITITVTDDTTPTPLNATEQFNVEVIPVNDKPIASSRSFSVNEDTLYSSTNSGGVYLYATDATFGEGLGLQYTIDTNVSNGTLTLVNNTTGEFTYMPNQDYNGSDSFTYTATETSGDTPLTSDPATVTITVNAVNDAPLLNEIPDQTILEDCENCANGEVYHEVTVSATDVDTADLTFSCTSSDNSIATCEVATDNLNDAVLRLTPLTNRNGSITITVQVSDGALTDSKNFTLNITPVNDPPVLAPIANQSVAEDDSNG